MNPPSTLLDLTFLRALADEDDPDHDQSRSIYAALLDDFLEQRCLLFGRADHLAELDKPDLFAAIDKLHVARQHRNAASELARTGVDADLALTVVLIHRCRIRAIATYDERLSDYDVDVIPSPSTNFVAVESLSDSAATKLESGSS